MSSGFVKFDFDSINVMRTFDPATVRPVEAKITTTIDALTGRQETTAVLSFTVSKKTSKRDAPKLRWPGSVERRR